MPEELRQQSPEQRLGPQTVEFYRPRQIQLQSPGTVADSEPFEARGGDFDDEVNELDRLASLSPLEYDRERMDAAERLSVRVGTLDREVQLRRATAPDSEVVGSGTPLEIADPEAWPSAVSGSSLLDELIAVVRKYVHMKEESALAVALWVLHAHAHNAARISPILSITSPVLGCGKTTVLALLGALCPRPLSASNRTTVALFRSVERWKPTLLVDEADTFLKKSDEMRGVLNSGHTRFNAYVIRTVGEDHEPRLFGTWVPKAIALIGALPDTLASRAIEIRMRRLARGESVDELRPDRLEHLEPLRRQAWQWVQDNLHELRPADPVVPLTVLGRAADNWRPLLAIAEAVGDGWPVRARVAAEAFVASGDDHPKGVQLLADIRDVFSRGGADRLWSEDLVSGLVSMEDQAWPEWRDAKPITTRQVAILLKPFGVQPRTIRIGDHTAKGYLLASFEDAFARYLPDQSVTASQTLETGACTPDLSVTTSPGVTDRKTPEVLASRAL